MALQVLNGPFIQPGESLSDALDCRSGEIVRITMPAQWDGGNITFMISTDGALFNDLVDREGNPMTLVWFPAAAVVLGQFSDYLRAIAFLKVRAGTRDHPVRQKELREFAVAVDVPDAAPLTAARTARKAD